MPNDDPLIEQINRAKDATQRATNALLKTFAAVPDDKLNWSPSPTARTPVWIAAHSGTANDAFAAILRGEPSSLPSDPKEAAAVIRAEGQTVTTREEAVALVEENTAKILAALDSITPERMETTPRGPFGPIPFAVWLQIPSGHMLGHVSQLEYLQTIWGDLESHS